jgi:YidC/Oxa1 family membrane protein insertase
MNFDRNTVIGFVLLAVLFFGFFYYTNKQQAALTKQRAYEDSVAHVKDSIAKLKQPKTIPFTKADSNNVAAIDSNLRFNQVNGTEQLVTVENDLIKVVFTNKGGQPKSVELKKFKGPDSTNVKLAATAFDKIDYSLKENNNSTDSISGLYFSGGQITKNGDAQVITYQLQGKDGSSVTHKFTVKTDYMIDFDLSIKGANQLLSSNTLFLSWQNKAVQQQKDLSYERQQSMISYRENGDYDHSSALKSNSEEFKKPLNWLSVKQQFFNTTLIDKNNFSGGSINWVASPDDKSVVAAVANLRIPVSGSDANIPLSIYYGPTDYKILKKYDNGMEDMVNLGSGIYAFVKYINRWIVIPVFDWLSKLTPNFGIAILLLTLFIRLLTSPLMYPGYLTSAKMKILKPELAQLKLKYPEQQQYAMEQMKFMREAGVNQFAGCLPSLLQIPIFFALYAFFNSSVALRGQSFLWSHDLSQYDSIVNFGFSIPLYGNHVSLFTITAAATSFLISLYGLSNTTPDQGNPMLKYMPYFFPVVLLFIFNRLPSGLTWYYTVSNLVTLGIQFVIQHYIINHDRIIAQIEANRKKPKKQSKWQERIAQMQEQQKQMQERSKNRR